jgi:hypothetical protein
MEITRNVILDLLPLYLADEVSADTRALVEDYLERDPDLAEMARQSTMQLPQAIPVPLTKEDEMEAYEKAKQQLFRRIIIIAASLTFLGLLIMAFLAVAWMFLFSA